ncbi:siderophore-interacting protein [Gordonia sp. (in: high G+C Gram-positive bacteria)]|uniref:siderophore-interacting protein n=1 Tax=Gordonia sp. (in: high G+C Gram-positive bacteria) TaxID=84139 RepID=UPI002608BC86|nr:siderophore-interacting protein [Gordonia sp. (in: high G+C Gram-positive bacteria)]
MATQTKTPGRGWQGAVMKLMGADDFEITVTRTETVTDHYLRLGFTGGGLLAKMPKHPTMWIRLWFEDHGALHQRGYTLVDPDPDTDTFDIEFAIHDGTAARWARGAQPGDTLQVTVMGSDFSLDPEPTGWLIAGDTASLPAINSLLDARDAAGSSAPATIWFEYQHDDDRDLDVHVSEHDTLTWIRRENDGAALVDAVRAAAFDASGHRGWVALDSKSTRAVTGILRNDFQLGRKGVKSMAYWKAGKSFA